jgi:hypothetical protein
MPLRLRILSDLHLEVADWRYQPHGEDLVVLAGDIANQAEVAQQRLMALLNSIAVPVIYVAGNHEFYESVLTVDDIIARLRDRLPPHVRVLHREMLDLGSVRFLGCPLWTDFTLVDGVRRRGVQIDRETAMHAAAFGVSDFAQINADQEAYGTYLVRPSDMAAWHAEDRAWLGTQIANADRTTVVITHWLPSPASVSARFVGSLLTPYFANDCRDLMHDPVRLWIHGHTHDACDYLHQQRVRVVCNPRGYGDEPAPGGFRTDLLVEV